MSVKNQTARLLDRLFPRLWLERELRSRPNHFEPEMFLVPLLCDRAHTAIDIGANTGSYSFYMARFAGRVISFEPNLDLWPRLRRILGPQAQIESAALSDHTGTATFRIDSSNTGVATIEEKNDLSCVADKSIVTTRTVQVRPLDSFGFDNVSLIKIDTEGHEESVLRGAQQTLRDVRPALIVESEDRHNHGAPVRVAELMDSLGYRCLYIQHRGLHQFDPSAPLQRDPCALDYINNFIFIPAENTQLLEKLHTRAATL